MTDQERTSLFPIFRFFSFAHLPPHLQKISKPFYDLAALMIDTVQDDPLSWSEKETGLRKLLEAKDCFVRAGVKQQTNTAPSLSPDNPDSDVFYKILLANELGGNISQALRFSDADGVGSGKSGYSFGVSQFDLKNNPKAAQCLKAVGIIPSDIQELINQTISGVKLSECEERLNANANIVAEFDKKHMQECLDHVGNLCNTLAGIRLQDMETFYHIADYHNQFYLTPNGKLHEYLKAWPGTITPMTILNFKLGQTVWGNKRPDDVQRRFNNISKICREKK